MLDMISFFLHFEHCHVPSEQLLFSHLPKVNKVTGLPQSH